MSRRRPSVLGRALRTALVGGLVGAVLLLVPDSQPAPPGAVLVKVERASGVDVTPEVVWILALGSDARPGEDIERSRADAIQLVGINTRTGAAAAMGVPRDSYVDIPGVGRSKINAAMYYGGPKAMAAAVGGLIGIEPDYVMVTGFSGFEAMVNDIGGITVDSRFAFSDPDVGPGTFGVGKQRLNGSEALTFSRSRHYLPAGDFDRSANQQRSIRGILGRIRAEADQPGFLERGALSVLEHLYTDLSPAQVFQLAVAVSQVDPAKVTTCVLPGSTGYAGAASVVYPDVDAARAFGDAARDDATVKGC